MSVNLDDARHKRLASALSDAHAQVEMCEKAIAQNQLQLLSLRRELIAALAQLSDAKRRYDQAK